MNWLTKISNHDEMTRHTDFIGYHCQSSEYFDGEIINDNDYSSSHYIYILDALPNDLRDQASTMGLLHYNEVDKYSDEFDAWAEKVHEFLWDNGIRWIFVSGNVPLGGDFTSRPGSVYGDHCYYTLMPGNCVLHIFDDAGVNDIAYAYLYDSKVGQPQLIPIPEEQEFSL